MLELELKVDERLLLHGNEWDCVNGDYRVAEDVEPVGEFLDPSGNITSVAEPVGDP